MTRDELAGCDRYRLRRMRIDSVAQTATLTSLAFLLSSGLGPLEPSIRGVSGSPMSSYGMRGAFYTEAYVGPVEPWLQPCGVPVAPASLRKFQRHSVHRALKRVKTQLRTAQNQFRENLKDIHDIYAKVYKVLKSQYRMSWLPDKQLEWYHREVWCLEKDKKAERALPRLYDALQRFAITFHHLRKFKLRSNINTDVDMARRDRIMDDINFEIGRVLCEVETAIINLGIKLPKNHDSMIVTDNRNWAREGDFTLMLVQDSGVLRLYQAFLNDWIRALRNATVTGSGACDPAKLQSLASIFKPKRQQQQQQQQQKHKKVNKRPKSKRPYDQNQRRVARRKILRRQQQQQQQQQRKF